MRRILLLLLVPCLVGVISIGCDDDSSAPDDLSHVPDMFCAHAGDAGPCR